MMATILNCAILDSASLVIPLKLTHNCQVWFPPFAEKKTLLIHSDSTWWWQPSWIPQTWIWPSWDSAILVYPLKLTHTCQDWYPPFAEKTSLIHSDSTWWWQPSWILPFCRNQTSPIHSHSTWWGQPSWILPSWIQPFCTKKDSFIHFDSTWWWQPSWILPCWIQTLPIWIQTPCYLLSDSLKNTLTPLWLWLKLIQSD